MIGRQLATGALLGLTILGPGGRLAMRGITLLEERAHQFMVAFSLLCYGLAVVILTPLTVNRLLLFSPVIWTFILSLNLMWPSHREAVATFGAEVA